MISTSLLVDLFALCKLKVVALLLLTAVVGMFLSTPTLPPLDLVIYATLGIGMTSASAAVFNHVIDEKIDIKMQRTKNRPLPQGRISKNNALLWGWSLGVVGLSILYFLTNPLTALLTFISLIGYAVFYTMYLKQATPQNIVIGGAAGAAPPVLGWVAITGDIHAYSLLLFLIIFVWTPPHFWALAIYRYEDYKKADIPMLPVTHGIAYTKTQVLLYVVLLFLVTLLPYLSGMSGIIYLLSAIMLNSVFLFYAIKVYRQENNTKIAYKTFIFSINYLMLLFVALLGDHYWI